MGIVVLSIIAFFYNLHKEPLHFTQLHCYEDLMEVLPKEGKAIYLKTQDIRGGRFYLRKRKNYIKHFGIQFQIRDSLVNIDIPLSADDYFLLKKYFKQYSTPLYDNVQDNNIFKEHYYYLCTPSHRRNTNSCFTARKDDPCDHVCAYSLSRSAPSSQSSLFSKHSTTQSSPTSAT